MTTVMANRTAISNLAQLGVCCTMCPCECKAGHGVTLPTYEAWTFGMRHGPPQGPPGPGTGKYGVKSALGNTGFRYGSGRPRGQAPEPQAGPGPMELTSHGPYHSFGQRHPVDPNKNPGPGQYKIPVSWKAKTSSWGPPPEPKRPISVPVTYETPLKDTRIPISFKAKYKPIKKDPTPAPHDYQKRCMCDCKNCCQNHGPSFGMRTNKRPLTPTPGPNMLDNTLGVATCGMACAPGCATECHCDH